MIYWILLLSAALSVRPAWLHLCRLARRQIIWPVRLIMQATYITNFPRNRKSKSFFSQDSKEMCSLIFVSAIKTLYQENIPFLKPIHMYVFIKNIIRKTVTGVFVFSSICTKLVNIKNKTILNMYYIRYLQKARRKKLLKKMDSSKKTIVKLSRKIDLRGGGRA